MKTVKYTLATLVFLWWFFLSHVTFTTDGLYSGSLSNEGYQAKDYHPAPTNFFGLYFWLVNEQPVFSVLYDSEGRYLGRSSPFLIVSSVHLGGGENVLPETYDYDKKYDRYDSFYITGEPFDGRYTISAKNKTWWSWLLQFVH